MNRNQEHSHRQFVFLLLFLAGIDLALLLIGSDEPEALAGGSGIALTLIVAFVGWITAPWILIFPSWREHPRSARLDLGFAYLALGWSSGMALVHYGLKCQWLGPTSPLRAALPGTTCCTAAGLVGLTSYLVLRVLPALARRAERVLPNLRRRHEDEDVFP